MDLQEIMLNAQENEDDIEKQSFSDDMVRGISRNRISTAAVSENVSLKRSISKM